MKLFPTPLLLCALLLGTPWTLTQADETTQAKDSKNEHYVAVHIDEDDPKRMNMVLNNVSNLKKHYDGLGQSVTIEIVAYGPGLNMLRVDSSPVKDRIDEMHLAIPELQFSACANTIAGMEKISGKPVELLDAATVVPSGVVRLVELQEQGYAYVRP